MIRTARRAIGVELRAAWRTDTLRRLLLAVVLVIGTSTLLGTLDNARFAQQAHTGNRAVADAWRAMPAANPHAVAHVGTVIFRPRPPLAGLEPGVLPHFGAVIRLQAHQRIRISGVPVEMDGVSVALSPARLVQLVLPLLLVLAGTTLMMIAAESPLASLAAACGLTTSARVFAATVLMLAAAAGVTALLCLAAMGATALSSSADDVLGAAGWGVLHFPFFLGWAWTGVVVRLLLPRESLAVATACLIWAISTLLVPYALTRTGAHLYPLQRQHAVDSLERAARVDAVRAHATDVDANARLRDSVLHAYGVKTLEQLPVNFDAILMNADEVAGARASASAREAVERALAAQHRVRRIAAVVAPMLAMQDASMQVAGTHVAHAMTDEAMLEAARLRLMQRLNDDMATASRTGDWNYRAERTLWQQTVVQPRESRPLRQRMAAGAGAIRPVAPWLLALAITLLWCARRGAVLAA